MEEPSVLDYLKSKLMPWRAGAVEIPDLGTTAEPGSQLDDQSVIELEADGPTGSIQERVRRPWPWRSLAALLLALAAQLAFEPPGRSALQGILLYAGAALMLAWSYLRGEWMLAPPEPEPVEQTDPLTVRWTELIVGAGLGVLAFAFFGGEHLFNVINFSLWIASLGLIVHAFWLPNGQLKRGVARVQSIWQKLVHTENWQVSVSRWTLLVLLVFGIAIFFRIYRLNAVPPEMVSDHAEKLLDVYDVNHGLPRIYFPRNTGREFFQMFLTAFVVKVFGTGYSFLSLKIGTALAGLLTLPFIYLTGVEIANRRVGLLAMFLAGIAYWGNVITRIALRFTLYPFFTAPTLYFLIRGLKRRSRNDFILSGIFLGLGLHGYSPMRIVPFLLIITVGLYLVHRQSAGGRRQAAYGLVLLLIIAAVVAIPLLRYTLDNPDMVLLRTMTRVSSTERALPGSPLVIFFQNLWRSLTMFAWDNGSIWVHSISGRPALGVISGALVHLGVLLVLLRYIKVRHWIDAFLLLSIPILMLPSILSLAFPDENPSLNRSGAALIPVFLIAALALDSLMKAFEKQLREPWGSRLAWSLVVVLFIWSAAQNYDLVFNQYEQIYSQSAWNTSEMGRVIKDFSETVGDSQHAWVVAYPYWVDTRLVGINAGLPTRDTAIWPDQIPETNFDQGTKLFILNPDDVDGLAALRATYPQGALSLYPARVEGKDFYIFLVPGTMVDLPPVEQGESVIVP